MNPDDFVEAVEKSREIVSSGRYDECPCANIQCEWHGNCMECVMIHRVKAKHVPECLQPMLRGIIRELAEKAELNAADARPGEECWRRLKEKTPPKKKGG